MSRSASRAPAIAAALLAPSLPCWAGTSSPIDLGGLVVLVLVVFLVIVAAVLRLAYAVAGRRGVMVLSLLGGGALACLAFTLIQDDRRRTELDARQSRAEQAACHERAGIEVHDALPQFKRVYLIDARPIDAQHSGWTPAPGGLEPGVAVLHANAPRLDRDALYAELSPIVEPVKGGEGRSVFGLRLHVSDDQRRAVATFTDFPVRGEYGCLGDDMPYAMVRLLQSLAGRKLGLRSSRSLDEPEVPISSLAARVGAVEKGKFFPERITPNGQERRSVTAGGRRWLARPWNYGYRAAAIRVEERDLQGALRRAWNIRLPPWHEAEAPTEAEVLGLAVEGSKLRIQVGFDKAYFGERCLEPTVCDTPFKRQVEYLAELRSDYDDGGHLLVTDAPPTPPVRRP